MVFQTLVCHSVKGGIVIFFQYATINKQVTIVRNTINFVPFVSFAPGSLNHIQQKYLWGEN